MASILCRPTLYLDTSQPCQTDLRYFKHVYKFGALLLVVDDDVAVPSLLWAWRETAA